MKKNQIFILAAVILIVLIAGIAYTKSDIFQRQTLDAPQGDPNPMAPSNPPAPAEAMPTEPVVDESPAE